MNDQIEWLQEVKKVQDAEISRLLGENIDLRASLSLMEGRYVKTLEKLSKAMAYEEKPKSDGFPYDNDP
jgi:hypothetical protein